MSVFQKYIQAGSGEIIETISCPDSGIKMQMQPDQLYIKGAGAGDTHYILNKEIIKKTEDQLITIDKTIIYADGTDSFTISNIPNLAKVVVANGVFTAYIVDDGDFEYSTDVQGEYTITISSAPFFDKVFTVGAI